MKYLHYITIAHIVALAFIVYWYIATGELLVEGGRLEAVFFLTLLSSLFLLPKFTRYIDGV